MLTVTAHVSLDDNAASDKAGSVNLASPAASGTTAFSRWSRPYPDRIGRKTEGNENEKGTPARVGLGWVRPMLSDTGGKHSVEGRGEAERYLAVVGHAGASG